MYTLPTIHLNGTGAATIANEYTNALCAASALRQALAEATCNARDFYPQGDHAWIDARNERAEIFAKLLEIEEYLTAWATHASDHNE